MSAGKTSPGRVSARRVQKFFALGLLLYLQFFLVYGASNYLASQRLERYRFYFEWERSIPLVPQFVYVYLSMSLFMLLPLRYLQSWQLRRWASSYMWMTFVAGGLFVLLPTELAAPRLPELPASQPLFALLYALDLPHNLFPSLHVAYTSLTLLIIIGSRYRDAWIWPVSAWWLLMLLSVLLVQQHYLLDIGGGLLLAVACYRFIYLAGRQPLNNGEIHEQ